MNWKFRNKALGKIYTGMFLGMVAYAAPVWAPELLHEYVRTLLRRAQRMALLMVTQCYRTVSTAALCVVAGVILF